MTKRECDERDDTSKQELTEEDSSRASEPGCRGGRDRSPLRAAPAEERLLEAKDIHRVDLTVNGRPCSLLVEPRWSLLFVLREKLGLTGAKSGAREESVGLHSADERLPRYACLTLALRHKALK